MDIGDWKKQAAKLMTLTELCEWLVAGRRQWQLAEAQFYLRLLFCENTQSIIDIVQKSGSTWEQFLREQAIVDVAKYRSFARAVAELGEEKCLEYGVDAAICALSVDELKRDEYAGFIGDYRHAHGGLPPARDTARDFANRANGRIPMPRATANRLATSTREDELQKQLSAARKEVKDLRAKLTSATKENRRLTVLVEKLRRQIGDEAAE